MLHKCEEIRHIPGNIELTEGLLENAPWKHLQRRRVKKQNSERIFLQALRGHPQTALPPKSKREV